MMMMIMLMRIMMMMLMTMTMMMMMMMTMTIIDDDDDYDDDHSSMTMTDGRLLAAVDADARPLGEPTQRARRHGAASTPCPKAVGGAHALGDRLLVRAAWL